MASAMMSRQITMQPWTAVRCRKAPAAARRALGWLAPVLGILLGAGVMAAPADGSGASTAAPPDPAAMRAIVAEFESLTDQVIDTGQVVGLAAAVVHRGEILSLRGVGVADARTRQPVDVDTVFRLASLTKGIASTTAAMLVREGFLQWDEPVQPWLPQFELIDAQQAASATVRDLVAHRLGLRFTALDAELQAEAAYPDLVARLRLEPLRCPVGDCYGYQNVAFSLIGDIAFSTSGEFFDSAARRRLFIPLGMDRANFGRDALTRDDNWARPHVRAGDTFNPVFPKETYYRVVPAAGANASIADMAIWAIAQLGHRRDVLPEDLLAEIHTPVVETPGELERVPWRRQRVRSAHYALGWRIYDYMGHRLVFHGGAVQGFRGVIALLPEHDFGVVMLWNNEAATPSGLLPTIVDRVLGLPPVDWLNLAAVERRPVIRPVRRDVGQRPAPVAPAGG
jgi:beta-lactamase class C